MAFLLTLFFFVGAIALLLKLYFKLTTKWCRSQVCLVGKTVIVTGGNCGIGYETALDLAKRGAKVILACRSETKGEEARRKIINETQNENVSVRILDLASFESVRAFAKKINEEEDRLDILVNNAGAVFLDNKRTVDGHQLLMQVNYFSNFLLSVLLLNLLKKSAPSRIVNVSSWGARFAHGFDLHNVDKYVSEDKDYQNSKLCNVFFTIELAKKLQGTGVTTYSLHPGFVKTEIFHNMKGFRLVLAKILAKWFARTCEEGAQTTIYCSVAKGIEKYNGEHFDNCQKIERYKTARIPDLPQKLWKKTEEIVGLKEGEIAFEK